MGRMERDQMTISETHGAGSGAVQVTRDVELFPIESAGS